MSLDKAGSCLISILGIPCTGRATVYGRIPALQNPSPGRYSDTITVTITY
ncbi:MAG: spore coat protein U domain-containing protein [Acidithiobacillus sp.]|nr:spore coat protein U domain-containing protein [Acidithiobacillus sp.]